MTEHVCTNADAVMVRGEDNIRTSEVVVGMVADVGRLRTTSEDGHLTIAPAFVAVDGMGGHATGRMATQMALDSLYSLAGATITDVDTVVCTAVVAQGTTTATPFHAAYLSGAMIAGVILTWIPDKQGVTRSIRVIFSIGDARVHLLRGDMFSQVARDYSRVQILIGASELTPEQVRRDSRRNTVVWTLDGGIADSDAPNLYSVPATARGRLLICFDGLSDELGGEAIVVMLVAGYTAQRTVKLLVAAFPEGGGCDSTTAVIVDALQVPDLPPMAHLPRPGDTSSQGAQ